MMQFVHSSIETIESKFSNWMESIDLLIQTIIQEKDLIQEANEQFKVEMQDQYESFIDKQKREVQEEGSKMRNEIEDMMKKYTAELSVTVEKAERCNYLIDEVQRRYETEYQSFFTERKRWKSDFQAASDKAVNNFNQIESLMTQTLTENSVNTNALKMVLDAIMIDQLIARQDIEDRK